jgi:hypothetical protein
MISTTHNILKEKGLYNDVINIIDEYLFGTKKQTEEKYKKNVVNILNKKLFVIEEIWGVENIIPYRLFSQIGMRNRDIFTDMYGYKTHYQADYKLRYDMDKCKTLTLNELVNLHLPYIRPIVKRKIQILIDFIKLHNTRYKMDNSFQLENWINFQLKKRGIKIDSWYYKIFRKLVESNCGWDKPKCFYVSTFKYYENVFNNMYLGDEDTQYNKKVLNKEICSHQNTKIISKLLKHIKLFMKKVRFYKHFDDKKYHICVYEKYDNYDDDNFVNDDKILIQQNKSKNNKNVDLIFEDKIDDNKWEIKKRKCELKCVNDIEYISFMVKGYGKVQYPTYLLLFGCVIDLNNDKEWTWRSKNPTEDGLKHLNNMNSMEEIVKSDKFKINGCDFSVEELGYLIYDSNSSTSKIIIDNKLSKMYNLRGNNKYSFNNQKARIS